eukprot:TRINITY_DN2728_c4_g1_i1.p2 TRINITY_DN2728_c4_g1~~TRINITY_DN2728_c4_g1_i1.p2  ORF type:complete len:325 (+),score=129.32 TRINITY_DN2728_c4_g1_i1:83-976(+)
MADGYLPDIRDWEEFGHIPQERESRRRDQLEKQVRDIFKLFERDNNSQCDVREVGTMVRALGLNPLEKQLEAMIEEMEEKATTGFIKYKRDPIILTKVKREAFDQIKFDFRDAIHVVGVPDPAPQGYEPPRPKDDPPFPGGSYRIQKGMRLNKVNGKAVVPAGPDGKDGLRKRLADIDRAAKEDQPQDLDLEMEHKLFDTDCGKKRRFYELMMETLLTHTHQGVLMVRDSEERILKAFETLDPERRGYIDSEYLKELMTSRGEKFTNEEVLEMLNAAADPETGYIKYDDYAPILATD